MRTFTEPGAEVIIPQPSFSMYTQWAAVNRLKVVSPAYANYYCGYPAQTVLAAINPNTRIIFVCNPNNPTGTPTDLTIIELLAVSAPQAIIFVDEAYGEYANVSAVKLLAKHPNIIVTRTFSKAFGLAGYRVGYILASAPHINELRKVRGPFDVNAEAVAAVLPALADSSAMRDYCREVMTLAKPLVEASLTQLGIKYLPSAANFLLFPHADAATIAEQLVQAGWRVKTLQLAGLGSCIRVTIGPTATMRRWLAALEKILAGRVTDNA